MENDCKKKKLEFDYKKLKLKIKEVFDTQDAFAEAMGMSQTAISQRLNNGVEWKPSEMVKACDLLHIPLIDLYLFFYAQKV